MTSRKLDYNECIKSIPISFATVSIGTPETPLPDKLKAIFSAGFKGIELGFPDLQSYAKIHHGKEISEDDYDSLCKTASEVKSICDSQNLKVMMLQPFANFEGWPKESSQRDTVFQRAAGWIRIMKAVGCDLLQVGSTDSEDIVTEKEHIVSDLQQLADLLAEHNFKMAYENWCWSTHAPTWSHVWDIVKAVNRPNTGLCLDTFQSAGSEYGDPTTSTGRIENKPHTDLMKQYTTSLNTLSSTIPADKIYLLQISDAYKPHQPLDNKPDTSGLRPRGQWSHDFRPLPFEGGYLPIIEFARAVLKTGFRGWFSVEVFDGGEHGSEEREADLQGYARRAMESVRRLIREACEGE